MEVAFIMAAAATAFAFCMAWSERTKIASNERIEMARMADKKATDELFERVKKLEKTVAENEFSIGKLHAQLDMVRAQNQRPARPITGLRT